jgi:hypothetical protein
MVLIRVFGVLYARVVGFTLWAGRDIRRFLDRNPRITRSWDRRLPPDF